MDRTVNGRLRRGFDLVDITEILKLSKMLSDAGIAHDFYMEREVGGASIKIPNHIVWQSTGKGVSVIQHRGSYGGQEGKLEVWIKPDMKEPKGWMTAEDVLWEIRKSRYWK